jgi:hypothetical protein
MTEQKKYARRPARRGNGWVVVIADGPSPLAAEIEVIPFDSEGAARGGYRNIKKQIGKFY